jgi:hypothetical protein
MILPYSHHRHYLHKMSIYLMYIIYYLTLNSYILLNAVLKTVRQITFMLIICLFYLVVKLVYHLLFDLQLL